MKCYAKNRKSGNYPPPQLRSGEYPVKKLWQFFQTKSEKSPWKCRIGNRVSRNPLGNSPFNKTEHTVDNVRNFSFGPSSTFDACVRLTRGFSIRVFFAGVPSHFKLVRVKNYVTWWKRWIENNERYVNNWGRRKLKLFEEYWSYLKNIEDIWRMLKIFEEYWRRSKNIEHIRSNQNQN